jgi:hypothetical protein
MKNDFQEYVSDLLMIFSKANLTVLADYFSFLSALKSPFCNISGIKKACLRTGKLFFDSTTGFREQ